MEGCILTRLYKMALIGVVIFLLPIFAHALEVPDSGIVRIRVDTEDVIAGLNGVPLLPEADGSRLTANSWFSVQVPVGLHILRLTRDGFRTIERSVIVKRNEVATVDISHAADTAAALDVPSADTVPASLGRVVVFSDPPGAAVRLDELEEQLLTPLQMTLHAGEHSLQVSSEDFEPLAHQLAVLPDHDLSLRFLLKRVPPPPLTAGNIGMEYIPTVPLIDEAEADRLRQKCNNLAETFAIIPFGQGILAKLVLGSEDSRGADVLIISGAGLTVGSYVLGKILSSKKRTWVRDRNQAITLQNQEAAENNKHVDQLLREKNAAVHSVWESGNRDRGRVEVLQNEPDTR